MSDILNINKSYDFAKYGDRFALKRSTEGNEVSFKVTVQNKCLKSWYDFKKRSPNVSYVQMINGFLAEYVVLVKENCGRVEELLRGLATRTNSKLSTKRGRAYMLCAKNIRHIVLRSDEIEHISDIKSELENVRSEKLTQHCNDLADELINTKEEKCEAQQKLNEQIIVNTTLHKKQERLLHYVEELQGMENKGKKISEVGERQQYRKLKELKSKIERSVWFARTFGLSLSGVEVKDDTGVYHTLTYDDGNEKKRKSYKDLTEDEKDLVKQTVFITDQFCIGEAAYHELTMVPAGADLPRSYLLKQCKKDVNSLVHITRTPGEAEGAQLDFQTELANVIRKKIESGEIKVGSEEKVKVKISGDGAKMTRRTNFVVLSFSIVDSDDVMSSKGNHTLAVVKGQESYELLKSSCSQLFDSINNITTCGKINVDGNDIMLEMFLGGDYKFLLEICGMKGATSDHSCIWCKLHKEHRHDMTKPMNYYWELPLRRSLQDIIECARSLTYSCVHPPLLKIDVENIVLDELHLMLRVTDVLLNNLVSGAISADQKENHNKPPSQRTRKHVDALLTAVRNCGVCFSIWEKKNADGGGSGTYDFTSLMGPDKKLLLKHLPQTLLADHAVESTICPTVTKLWSDFNELYSLLTAKTVDDVLVLEYFEKAKKWINLFLSLQLKATGYMKKNITPYMHAMVYHAPFFMCQHSGLSKFTGQGVEKKNDDCRRIHLFKSNKWDASRDVFLVSKRLENLQDHKRKPREYRKKNAEYWEITIKEKRSTLRKNMQTPTADNTPEEMSMSNDVAGMTPREIRAKLKQMGFPTKARNIKRLQALYELALESISL